MSVRSRIRDGRIGVGAGRLDPLAAARSVAVAKASASGADAVILDLEDAVTPEHRRGARVEVARWLETADRPDIVYVNHGEEDAAEALVHEIRVRHHLHAVAPHSNERVILGRHR